MRAVCTLILAALLLLSASAQNPGAVGSAGADAEVKKKLRDFEQAKLTLEALTEKGGEEFDRRLITFYSGHTNEVSVKALLPISRCYAFFDNFNQAAQLAERYAQIYSNDWHGWRIIGAANFALTNLDEALSAFTNAVRLGDKGSCVQLGACAWKLDRLDIMNEILPCLFTSKNDASSEKDKTYTLFILLVYSTNGDREDVFVKALAGVEPSEIAAREDLTSVFLTVYDRFKTKDLQPFCEKVRALSKNRNEGKQ
jgi:tetratricopeptide (TPR) repeat protein